jgi:phosphohistidine phosphatase
LNLLEKTFTASRDERSTTTIMKTVLLIRHSKSDWSTPSLGDFDRPLNERGKHDAPMMARRLYEKKINIDVFVSSPAKRAKKTAGFFARQFKREKEDIIYVEELYGASQEVFQNVIADLSDKFQSVAIFSHNPGITDFANSLTNARIDNIPTTGIFAIKVRTDRWAEFEKAEKEFWFVDYPKSGAGQE